MSNCVLGPTVEFGSHHSARICTRCGSVSVFLDETLCARFDEQGEELQTLNCAGFAGEALFILSPAPPDTLQISRDGRQIFQIIERGERLEKLTPGPGSLAS